MLKYFFPSALSSSDYADFELFVTIAADVASVAAAVQVVDAALAGRLASLGWKLLRL